MERWTMEDLSKTDDISFAVAILNERRAKLCPYSPLGLKLAEAAHTLKVIREEKERFMERIVQRGLETGAEEPEAPAEEGTGNGEAELGDIYGPSEEM